MSPGCGVDVPASGAFGVPGAVGAAAGVVLGAIFGIAGFCAPGTGALFVPYAQFFRSVSVQEAAGLLCRAWSPEICAGLSPLLNIEPPEMLGSATPEALGAFTCGMAGEDDAGVRSMTPGPFPVMSGPSAYGSVGTRMEGAAGMDEFGMGVPVPEIEKSELGSTGFGTFGGGIAFVVVPLEAIPGIAGGRRKSREVVICVG